MLPLVDKSSGGGFPGWCTYADTLSEQPEIEILCGGINSKKADAAALWRQGNLLHFGFEQSPAELNDTGDALLVNSIVYIAKFTQDRPTILVRSPFAGGSTRPRSSAYGWLRDESMKLDWFEACIDEKLLAEVGEKTREGYRKWFDGVRDFLHPGDENRLTLDQEAQSLVIRFDRISFFEQAIKLLDAPATGGGGRAYSLLTRYAPDGPIMTDSPVAWKAWFEENRPYLFFSEWGGYRWYIDSLAKSRHVPTAELRGPKRADSVRPASRPTRPNP